MDTMMVGKRAELFVFGQLLERCVIPYVPLLDVEGIDATIRLGDGEYREIQVKKAESLKDPRWFQVKNLKSSERLFIICVEPDNTAWIIPSLVFQKYATKSKTGEYDLDLDQKPRGRRDLRKELLSPYRDNWDLLVKSAEDLEDLLAMYESMAAPEEEAVSLEEYKKLAASDV
ncbi:MAG: hypothetical protein HYY04_09965 [Chloroflexi bacterium]|nr:hypothetical protein [Chloroflexota bacterium]